MKTRALAQKNTLLTSLCFGLFLLSIVTYVYFLSTSVVHVVIRQEGVQRLGELRSEVATLESEYIAAKLHVSAKVAALDGFTESNSKVFISKREQSLVLNTEQ